MSRSSAPIGDLKPVTIVLGLVVVIAVSAIAVSLFSNSSPPSSSPNNVLSFTYTISGNTYSFYAEQGFSNYSWDFGDASTGTGSTISHTYQNNGTYIVGLTANPLNGSQSPLSTSQQLIVTTVTTIIHHYFENLNVSMGNQAT